MSSASELFHNRRYRIGRNDPELGFGSSLDRSLPLPVLHHHNRRRSRHHQRRGGEIEDCDSLRRPPSHSRHLAHREHESVRFDHGASQFSTGNSSSSSETSSGRANRMQLARSEQLPGDVLLARERLLERLRGVSISSNRQSSRLMLSVPWAEFTYNDDVRLVDAGDWEIETSEDLLTGDTPISDSSTPTDTLSSLPNFSTKRPPGLNGEELNHLHREVFTNKEKDDALVLEVVLECSICLDRFQKGDELICLPCEHKFHSGCLYPWVQTCGDCPNCRAGVVIGMHKTPKEA